LNRGVHGVIVFVSSLLRHPGTSVGPRGRGLPVRRQRCVCPANAIGIKDCRTKKEQQGGVSLFLSLSLFSSPLFTSHISFSSFLSLSLSPLHPQLLPLGLERKCVGLCIYGCWCRGRHWNRCGCRRRLCHHWRWLPDLLRR
jgi:hypothetical protein